MKSTLELLNQGIANQQKAHASGEEVKLGNFRAGSSGIVVFGGKVTGQCMRIAYLRSKGIDGNPATSDRESMFSGGRANEDIIVDLLKAANEEGLAWLREEEYPMEWFTTNGRKVTGRPDIVLGKLDYVAIKDGVPVPAVSSEIGGIIPYQGEPPIIEPTFVAERILELKLVSASATAKSVGIEMKPKLSHVIQAAHYSLKLDLPVEIWYTSQADFVVSEYAKKEIPKDHPRVVYNWQGVPTKILPFRQGYSLGWNDKGQLYYQAISSSGLSEPTLTIVTKDSIVEFFERLSMMESTDELPPKPSKIDLDGGEQPYSLCNYCALKDTCATYKGKSTKEWTAKVLDFKAAKEKKKDTTSR